MWITLVLIALFLATDQVTKFLAETLIKEFRTIEAIPHVLDLTLVYNKGAAWGFLSNNTWILVIISILGSILLGWYAYKNDWKKKKILSLGVTMAFAGCVGNLIDRFMSVIPSLAKIRPGVVDMISFEPLNALSRLFTGYDFPVFNVADAFLVVGVILISIDIIFFEEKRNKENENSN